MIENTFPLVTFYPQLSHEEAVIDALNDKFKEKTEDIINKLMSGIKLQGDELYAEDIIADIVSNDSVIVESFTGYGSYGEFPIEIMKFGTAFWIRAPEFDDIGFFNSSIEASECASSNYESYSSPWDED